MVPRMEVPRHREALRASEAGLRIRVQAAPISPRPQAAATPLRGALRRSSQKLRAALARPPLEAPLWGAIPRSSQKLRAALARPRQGAQRPRQPVHVFRQAKTDLRTILVRDMKASLAVIVI